ncbi:MAG: Octanoyltransferase LipM [Pelotomaculum sp. PtaB.Bin104]|nr:MAG: Octanoyltransferase LipM [Pelotomaculum sp. PtaB.Bin104]
MAQRWRLIDSGPGDPSWNMAVDEVLVSRHARGESPPVLRMYTWSPPALSLGYFQKMTGIRFDLLDRLGIVPVRRSTGGRAVLHYGDLTYSIAVSLGQGIPPGLVDSFRYLCQGLLDTFAPLGIEARLGLGNPSLLLVLPWPRLVILPGTAENLSAAPRSVLIQQFYSTGLSLSVLREKFFPKSFPVMKELSHKLYSKKLPVWRKYLSVRLIWKRLRTL